MSVLILKHWKLFAIIALLAFLMRFYHEKGYEKANKEWKLKWSQRDKQDAQALAQRQLEAREKEQQWQERIGEISDDARRQIDAANRDVNAARAAANGLHDKANRFAKRLAERERACNTQITGRSQATNGAELLADMFRRADEEAGRMAEVADRARIAGLACERAYDSLRK